MSASDYSYAQLHENNIPDMLASHLVGADELLALGRSPVASLNGKWHFMPDVYDGGLRAAWYREAGGEFEPNGPRDYDFDAAPLVDVPACWNSYGSEYLLYEGSAWFFRTFTAPEATPEDRIVLRFGAANYACMIFLNGRHVGSHIGGFTPFCVDITADLRQVNRLHIWVSNARRPDGVPAEFTDWYNYGGLYREIELHRVPQLSVADYAIYLDPDYRVQVRLRLNVAESHPVAVSIIGLGDASGRTDSSGVFEAVVSGEPELWSPERPVLYDTVVRCGSDELRDRVGLRRVETRGSEILLNGEPLFLRGVALHEDHPERFRSLTEADRRTIIGEAKALNCNFLRLAHYPHHEAMARLADEEGMLLWEEIPVYWSLQFGSSQVLQNARNQLSELIRRDINRASVVLWSVGNENPDSDERREFMRALVDRAKAIDSTRLVTAACLVDIAGDRISDRLISDLDVIAVNEYYGWYYGDFDRLGKLFSGKPDKPVVASEFGASAVAGLHGMDEEYWTEEMQERVLSRQLEVMISSGNVAGAIPWLLFDFRTPRRMNPFQGMFNRKGLLSEGLRTRKRAFRAVKEIYQSLIE
jgi:beta-glucuronidase